MRGLPLHPNAVRDQTVCRGAAARWVTRDEVQLAMNPVFAVRVLDAFDEDVHSRAYDEVNLVSGS